MFESTLKRESVVKKNESLSSTVRVERTRRSLAHTSKCRHLIPFNYSHTVISLLWDKPPLVRLSPSIHAFSLLTLHTRFDLLCTVQAWPVHHKHTPRLVITLFRWS